MRDRDARYVWTQPGREVGHPILFAVGVTDDNQPFRPAKEQRIAHILTCLPLIDLTTDNRVDIIASQRHNVTLPTTRSDQHSYATADHGIWAGDPDRCCPSCCLRYTASAASEVGV